MTIEERASDGVIILDTQGAMTIEALSQLCLANKVRQLVQEGHTKIVVNLAEVPYMDTSGLCNLVEAYIAATRRGGGLKLLHPTPRIRTLLTITRLLTVFDAYDAEADAVSSFGPGAPV